VQARKGSRLPRDKRPAKRKITIKAKLASSAYPAIAASYKFHINAKSMRKLAEPIPQVARSEAKGHG